MSAKSISLIFCLFMTFALASAAAAAGGACTVTAIEGARITLDCGAPPPADVKVGGEVRIKAASGKKAAEGC